MELYTTIFVYSVAIIFYILYLTLNIKESGSDIIKLKESNRYKKLDKIFKGVDFYEAISDTYITKIDTVRIGDLYKSTCFVINKEESAKITEEELKNTSCLYNYENQILALVTSKNKVHFTVIAEKSIFENNQTVDIFVFTMAALYFFKTYSDLSYPYLILIGFTLLVLWKLTIRFFLTIKEHYIKRLILS